MTEIIFYSKSENVWNDNMKMKKELLIFTRLFLMCIGSLSLLSASVFLFTWPDLIYLYWSYILC